MAGPVIVALERGFFAREGLEAEFVPFRGGPDLLKAVMGGDVLVGITGSTDILVFREAGSPIKMVATHTEGNHFTLNVAPDVSSVAGLKGKAIGVTRVGATTWIFARMLAKKEGWDPDKDVQIVGLGGLDAQLAALARREIAAYVWGDGGAVTELQGKSKVLLRFDVVTGKWISQIQYASEDAITHQADPIRRSLRALFTALKLMRESPRDAAEICSKKLGWPPGGRRPVEPRDPADQVRHRPRAGSLPALARRGRHPEGRGQARPGPRALRGGARVLRDRRRAPSALRAGPVPHRAADETGAHPRRCALRVVRAPGRPAGAHLTRHVRANPVDAPPRQPHVAHTPRDGPAAARPAQGRHARRGPLLGPPLHDLAGLQRRAGAGALPALPREPRPRHPARRRTLAAPHQLHPRRAPQDPGRLPGHGHPPDERDPRVHAGRLGLPRARPGGDAAGVDGAVRLLHGVAVVGARPDPHDLLRARQPRRPAADDARQARGREALRSDPHQPAQRAGRAADRHRGLARDAGTHRAGLHHVRGGDPPLRRRPRGARRAARPRPADPGLPGAQGRAPAAASVRLARDPEPGGRRAPRGRDHAPAQPPSRRASAGGPPAPPPARRG